MTQGNLWLRGEKKSSAKTLFCKNSDIKFLRGKHLHLQLDLLSNLEFQAGEKRDVFQMHEVSINASVSAKTGCLLHGCAFAYRRCTKNNKKPC
jgi:biotin synthase-like enzyme